MKTSKYAWWIVVNEFNQPLYKGESNGMMWIFITKKDATAFIKSREVDKKLKKVRKICRVIVEDDDTTFKLK